MLKIRAINIVANTVDGEYSKLIRFDDALNIIRGDNTSGKSTLVQSILYGLGMEELLDGKNEKTMQSTLKDAVEYPQNELHAVLESYVVLEIKNTRVVTIKRSVINQNKSAKLIEVYEGSLLVDKDTGVVSKPMWIHDKGGATNANYGFHLFLAEFLELELPEVYYSNGDLRKLYLQTLFPAFIIEQKKGWSDFLATIPFFGTKNAKNRVIEFILSLDKFKNEQNKLRLQQEKQNLIEKWKILREDLYDIGYKGAVDIEGIPSLPETLSSLDFSFFSIRHENRSIDLNRYLGILIENHEVLKSEPINTSGENIKEIEIKIKVSEEELNRFSINHELLRRNLRLEYDKKRIYTEQLADVRKELQQNKDAKKIYSLGATVELEVAKGKCPTCNQEIKDSLLPQSIEHTPMHIDENVKYLQAQEKMIIAYVLGQDKGIIEQEKEVAFIYGKMNELRQSIRNYKRELIADERIPSVSKIEERVKLEAKIKFYTDLIETLENKLEKIKDLTLDWTKIIVKESKFKKDFYSVLDVKKLASLEKHFKELVFKFGYRSKPLDNIRISKEKYLPIVEGDSIKYDIRFDSSASDMIRSIWSYTCSLFKVSKEYQCNHPHFLLFDEPAQQSMSNESFNQFLIELSKYKDAQVLVFASFNNSDEDFRITTSGIEESNYINIGRKLLTPKKPDGIESSRRP